MKQIFKLCWLFVLCYWTITAQTAYAQEGDEPAPLTPTTRFDHLTTADGLADSHVEVIFQDSQGFIWFGTNDGLSRYDGYHFTNYRHEPDNPNSLAGNGILGIIEDKQGRLWIASGKSGVTLFDPRTEAFNPI
jgi:two-component system sensor histidine kinase ChiS